MAKQLMASPSTKKISDLYTRITGPSPSLILQPAFQRNFVWNSEHKEKFIETILKGLPIPEIYIAQSGIDVEKIETQEVVVDGQQRLSTIVQYIDEPDGSSVFGSIVPKYKDLKDERRDFLNYNIVIRDLGDIDSDVIREIFKRINSTQYSLNQVELHNAVYDGKFISTAKEILQNINTKNLPFLTESKITRMEDLYFVLSLMSTIENDGYFSLDTEIERYIVKYNDNYEQGKEITDIFISNFKLIEELELSIDSIWFRASNFFTLFVELFNHIYRKGNAVNPAELKSRLSQLEENVLKYKGFGKEENDFSKYYAYMYTGTNNRNARVIRADILIKYVFLRE